MPAFEHRLLINIGRGEERVALIEGGRLVEYYVQRAERMTITGNIYKGRVTRVLPGMQAAFVDIGLERSAFLHASDIVPIGEYEIGLIADAQDAEEESGAEEEIKISSTVISQVSSPGISRSFISSPAVSQPAEIPITRIVQPGQELIVQVKKEPIGSKGARLTSHLALAGRYLVFMPTVNNIGVSHRITDEKERNRLKEIVAKLQPVGKGFIIRTAAEKVDEEALAEDMAFLINRHESILKRGDKAKAPAQLDEELDLILRSIRDLPASVPTEIVVDDPYEYRRDSQFIEDFLPRHKSTLKLYEGTEPIFDAYGIEHELGQALQRRVWLKSGGYIIIDRTEALTAIDVNTGRFVGTLNLEDTITKINIEAAVEIAYQLRLRNIGGIIIIDFIDMMQEENRQKVLTALKEALRPDRARSVIYNISQLGLVEMTRKRVRESLSHVVTEVCPYCRGAGEVKTPAAITSEIVRDIQRLAARKKGDTVLVTVSPEIATYLYESETDFLESIENRLNKRVIIETVDAFHREQFYIDLTYKRELDKARGEKK